MKLDTRKLIWKTMEGNFPLFIFPGGGGEGRWGGRRRRNQVTLTVLTPFPGNSWEPGGGGGSLPVRGGGRFLPLLPLPGKPGWNELVWLRSRTRAWCFFFGSEKSPLILAPEKRQFSPGPVMDGGKKRRQKWEINEVGTLLLLLPLPPVLQPPQHSEETFFSIVNSKLKPFVST